MVKRGILILISFLALSTAAAQETTSDHPTESACPFIKIEPERLADLNIPRFGNAIFCANGEMTVTGGHTSGFIPTATAEYYKDGKWHLLQMVYPHDTGCSVVLKSGKVLLAGGYEKNLGIGQTHAVEMYDPQSHAFDGFGCMEQKRTQFTGLELDSGHVVLSGNWYHDDAIELFDGEASFTFVKDVSTQRNFPHIFQIAKDDAIFFSSTDIKGNTLDTIIWLIEAGKTEEAEEMVTELSSFFRHSLSNGEDVVTLEDEEKQVRSYLQIQQFRYKDIMDYSIDIDPAIKGTRLPKLTIQPLVENALYHGVKLKRAKGMITVTGKKDGEDIIITVSDTGAGMTKDRLAELRAGLSNRERVGFGLSTVDERLKLFFGEKYGLSIDSTEGEGTDVTVRIPGSRRNTDEA